MNTVSILTFLLKFMSTEQRTYLSLAAARCVGMKQPNIKKCTLSSTPKTSGTDIYPSIISEISRCRLPVSGCKRGSTAKSWHTSWSQFTIKSLSSLWQMKVNPPWWKTIAWLALNEAPHTQWLGTLDLANLENLLQRFPIYDIKKKTIDFVQLHVKTIIIFKIHHYTLKFNFKFL